MWTDRNKGPFSVRILQFFSDTEAKTKINMVFITSRFIYECQDQQYVNLDDVEDEKTKSKLHSSLFQN